MRSLIEELQRDALDSKVSVTELLQKCLVVGSKLKINALTDWARLELEGYKDAPVPEYRNVIGAPQVLNPVRGYQPLQFMSAEHIRRFSAMPFNQPLSELEHSLRQAEKTGAHGFHVNYSADVEIALRKAMQPPLGLPPSLYVNASQFHRILEGVRKAILEWALELESAGVLGDGMSFSPEEKQRATSVVYNVATNIYGDVDGSQVGAISGSNVQQRIAYNIDMAKLKKIVGALKDRFEDFELEGQTRRELEAHIEALAAQTTASRPKISVIKESLASVRGILEGIAGNLAAAAILHQIGSWG